MIHLSVPVIRILDMVHANIHRNPFLHSATFSAISHARRAILTDPLEVDIARAGSTGQKSTHSSAYPVRSPTMHQLAIQKAKEQVKIAMARKAYEAARGFEDDDDFYPG